MLLITDTRRVLYWPNRERGALELLPSVEDWYYYYNTDGRTVFYLLTSWPACEKLWFYRLPVHGREEGRIIVDLSAEIRGLSESPQINWLDDQVRVSINGRHMLVDYRTGTVMEGKPTPSANPDTAPQHKLDTEVIRRFINNGYNVLKRVGWLVVADGYLLVGGQRLELVDGHLKLTKRHKMAQYPYALQPVERLPLAKESRMLLRRFVWPDGSEALFDPRGLLHLRSSDSTLPELTLVLVQGKPLAAWAANETVCGPDYFTDFAGNEPPFADPDHPRWLSAADFYREYLQPFIQRLSNL